MEEHDRYGPLDRPTWACQLCPPPKGQSWTQADPKHATCGRCYDVMRERLAEVAERYLLLDPRPGASVSWGSRGSPGFVSRPPVSVHVVSMRDPRSSADARVWVGSDGRVHHEETRPPLSVFGVMSTLAWSIAEFRRNIHGESTPPRDQAGVFALVNYVDGNVGFVTKHAELAVEVDTALRSLLAGMRPVTGAGRRKIGPCPTMVDRVDLYCRCGHVSTQHDNDSAGDRHCNEFTCGCKAFIILADSPGEPEHVRCGAMLYTSAQLDEDTVTCPRCGKYWRMDRWLCMSDEVDASREW